MKKALTFIGIIAAVVIIVGVVLKLTQPDLSEQMKITDDASKKMDSIAHKN